MWLTEEDAARVRKGCGGGQQQGQYEMSWGTEKQQWGVWNGPFGNTWSCSQGTGRNHSALRGYWGHTHGFGPKGHG